jgi:hypothetical protein
MNYYDVCVSLPKICPVCFVIEDHGCAEHHYTAVLLRWLPLNRYNSHTSESSRFILHVTCGLVMVRRGSVMVRRGSVMVRRGSVMVRRGSVMERQGSVDRASACCKAGPSSILGSAPGRCFPLGIQAMRK